MPRPRGGDWLEDEVRAWKQAGVAVVVSLLEPDEATELELADEEAVCAANGVEFISFPIADRDIPKSRTEFAERVSHLVGLLQTGRTVAIHCRQGIGRAGMVAVGILRATGVSIEEAIEQVSAARGRPVPETPAQQQWLVENESRDRKGAGGSTE
jgi:protein-tyrosine phosphatase